MSAMDDRVLDVFQNVADGPQREAALLNDQSVRAVAFHLPQFHPIPENDEWWGKGFTEWTNVVKAKPRFRGHYQPHLPADLGFYDLRLPETRTAQAELAARYGITGFCYYHYWFNGRQVLQRPVNEIWQSGEPDFAFCLCWANENWTRKWDGQNDAVLLEQRYAHEDDVAHIRSLIPMFMDARYIRVDERPLFMVYRASQLPDPEKTAETWRREAERAGLKGLFLVRAESFWDEIGDPRKIGFDAGLQFQPQWPRIAHLRVYRRKWWHVRRLGTHERWLRENSVYDYEELVETMLAEPPPEYPRISCVCPGWDNSPRRGKNAAFLVNSSPEGYERWLHALVERQTTRLKLNPRDGGFSTDSLVFINAWNEWGEGNHLEPCQKWGRKYLEATQKALGAVRTPRVEYAGR